MKYLYLLFLSLILCNTCYGQAESFDILLNRGESQFNKDLEKPDYNFAINNLKKAIELNPGNAEAHYFLGYAYSRFNSKDASSVPNMRMPLVIKTSEEMERVISLTPLYKGKIISLDPYSKITSEWGSLAFCYLANNKIDSAKWAFNEGKKRGGYDKFILAIAMATLNGCSKNSILVSSGDNYTYPLYYLQLIEKVRPDVSVIDISLPNTIWYPKLVENTTSIKFAIKGPALDMINYIPWSNSPDSILIYQTNKFFLWTLKPSYQGRYLSRSDQILLSMLKKNQFKRDVYFTKGQVLNEQLSLENYLLVLPLIDKINAKNEQPQSVDQYIADVQKTVFTLKPVNPYSQEELTPIDCIRYDIYKKVLAFKELKQYKTADRLINLLKDYLPDKEFPCYSDELKVFYKYINNNQFN